MPDENTHIETGNTGDTAAEELNQLKKEMAKRIVNKIGEKNKDITLLIGKDIVTDYLVDEGDDKVNDFILGIGINAFTEYSDQLKDLRKKINQVESKQQLEDLEKSIINDLGLLSDSELSSIRGENPQDNSEGDNGSAASVAGATTGVVASSTSSSESGDNPSSSSGTSVESAPVGEAAEIPLDRRERWLFPEGKPTSPEEMKKYIIPINVPIRTPKGKGESLKLYIHKKLANEYQAIFQEMYDKRIPVNPKKTGGYNWRPMRNGRKQSHHSYGSAVDVNWDVNGGVHGPTDENSPYFNDQDTVAIWKRHGFYWGGDWSKGQNDPMHFTYMNA